MPIKIARSASSTLILACANELTDITKTANILGALGKGAVNSVKDGWKRQGGFGQAFTAGSAALQAPGVIAENDPKGEGRSRIERGATLGAGIAGGLAGDSVGTRIGEHVMKQLDPTDSFGARATRAIPNIKNNTARSIATGIQDKLWQQRGMGYRMANRGLRAIPSVLGTGGSILGMLAAERLVKKPFQWFGKQQAQPGVVGQFNNPETEQATVTLSGNN